MLSRNIGYYNKLQGYDRIFGSGKYNPITAFPGCTSNACLLFFNLESPFHPVDRDIQNGGFTFRANTNNLEVLQGLRNQHLPLLLSLANNHLLNGGYQGVVTTKQLLAENGIATVGAGLTPEEAGRVTQDINGLKLCFGAYSYEGRIDRKIGGGTFTRNPLDPDAIIQDLQEMKKLNCDAKILSLHRGAEYKLNPNKKQIELAHTFIDAGADLILGGHSHVPGKIEKYTGKYIFYSLGNFVFDQERGKTARGAEFDYIYDSELKRKTVPTYIAMLAGLQFVKNGSGTEILLDTLQFDTLSKGVHTPLDPQTSATLKELLWR